MEEDMYFSDGRIDISEEGIIYWTNKINCDPLDLKHAVSKVGDKYNVILLFLELNRKIKNK